MPKRQKDLVGVLSRRDAEKAILLLHCLNSEVLTIRRPRQLFDIRQWSIINGFSRKNNYKAGHSNWCYLRSKILKMQQNGGADISDTTTVDQDQDQDDDSACLSPSTEIINTARRDADMGKGEGIPDKLIGSASWDVLVDDEELVADSAPMVGRVIEFVDLEPIEIKDEDQFELDWRNLELHQRFVDSRDPRVMKRSAR